MLAYPAVVFAISGVAWKVKFVFNAPVVSVVGEQLMLVGQSDPKAGDSADNFNAFFAVHDTGASDFEDLCGEGKVDLHSRKGHGDYAARRMPPVGFFNGVMGRGKKCARKRRLQSAGASSVGCLSP